MDPKDRGPNFFSPEKKTQFSFPGRVSGMTIKMSWELVDSARLSFSESVAHKPNTNMNECCE